MSDRFAALSLFFLRAHPCSSVASPLAAAVARRLHPRSSAVHICYIDLDSVPAIENQILSGDCLDVLAHLPDACVDLAYLDPPFNTGRTLSASNGSYRDSWSGLEGHLRMMEPRMREVHRVLKPTGSILLHCDWRTCHHLRLMLDGIFGEENFVNHLIWCYGLGGSSRRRFARKHDDILLYGRTGDYWFEPPMVPARSARMKGMMKKATDVIEIPAINNMAEERCGYPTQKPLALLEFLVGACCKPGGLVLDPFCGSGTALVAAAKSQRRFLGIDANEEAAKIARNRVAASPFEQSNHE